MEHVLVVEDSTEMQRTICDLVLKPGGYQVTTTGDGAEGLQIILEQHPDLVILDERLPGMKGTEVLQALKEHQVQIPVVFMTSHGSEELVVQAFRLGVRDYVIKPFQPHDMQQIVDRVMEEKRLRAERDGLVKELRTLSAIGRSVTSRLELGTVLTRVVEAAVFLTHAEEGLLLLLEGQELVLRTAINIEERVARSLSVRVKDSLAEQVLRTGQPVTVSGRQHKVATGYLVSALVYMPIRTPERGNMGVLGVVNRISGSTFSQHEVQLLSALADYAGVALGNAQLYEQAEAERGKLTAVLRETAEAVVVLDTAGRIILCNPTATEILGLSSDAVGQSASAVITQSPLVELFQALEAEHPQHTEITATDGRTFNAQLSPVSGVGFVLMMQDISHLKELDRIKSEFVQNVSHELRAPLSLIRGYADLLATGELGELGAQQRKPIEIIARRTRMLSELLENVSLHLRSGERLLVTGPNGSGKTTLLRAIAGLLPPTEGRISRAPSDVPRSGALGGGIGFLFQNPQRNLFERTVCDEVAFSLRRMGRPEAVVRRRVEEVLELCGLGPHAQRSPLRLSFGEQHRVAVASVLAPEPDLLLLDEPFAGLDPESRARLLGLLAREQQRRAIAILVASHDEHPLSEWTHRRVWLDRGRIRDA